MKRTFLIFSVFAVSNAFAQEVVSSSGQSFETPNGGIDFTVGEVVIETVSNGTNTLTQGFHQTLLEIVGLEDHIPDLLVSLFPNPTSEFVIVEVSNFNSLTYQLIDQTGRLLSENLLKEESTKLSVAQFPAGAYTLQLTSEEFGIAKSYQIIKH